LSLCTLLTGEQSHILLLYGIKENFTLINAILLLHHGKGMPQACMVPVWKTISYAVSQLQLLLVLFMPVVSSVLNVFQQNCHAVFCMQAQECAVSRQSSQTLLALLQLKLCDCLANISPPCITASLSLWYQLRRQRLRSSVSSEGKGCPLPLVPPVAEGPLQGLQLICGMQEHIDS